MISRRAMARHNRGRVSAQGAGPVLPWYNGLAPTAAHLVNDNEYTDVSQLGDDTGGGLILQSTASTSQPTFGATSVGGKGAIVFASGDNLKLASAAALNGLKEEYGFALYIRGVSTANTQAVMSTYLQSGGSQNGMRLIFSGTSRLFWLLEQKAGAFLLNCQSAPNSVDAPPADYRVFARVSRSGGTPHARLYVNGVQLQTADYSTTTYAGDPDQPLNIAAAPGTGFNFVDGCVRALVLWDHDPGDIPAEVDAALLAEVSTRDARIVVPFGDSITANAASYRVGMMTAANTGGGSKLVFNGAQTPSGNFPLTDKRHEGVSGETIAQVTTRISAYSATGNETDIILVSGTNSLVPRGVSGSLTDKAAEIAAAKSKFPGKRIWVPAITYGWNDAVADTFKASGAAGSYNAGLPAVCSAANVNFIDIHSGATAWVPGDSVTPVDAQDDAGHPTVAGGTAMGTSIAVGMGINV